MTVTNAALASQAVGPPNNNVEMACAGRACKTPTLRNVKLTAPYFHNGGKATLEEVVPNRASGLPAVGANGTGACP